MSDPKSRSGNVEAGCFRCARSPCVCSPLSVNAPPTRLLLGFDSATGAFVYEPSGPRPVSAEDAMKRANEACALAEKAAKGAEVGSLSQTHRSIIESLRHAHANAVGRIDGCEGEVRSLWEKLSAWPHPDDLEARLVALEGRRPGDVPSGTFLGDAHNRLCVAVAGIEREMQTHAGETSRTFADVSARLVAADERIADLAAHVADMKKALGELGLRAGNGLADAEARHRALETTVRQVQEVSTANVRMLGDGSRAWWDRVARLEERMASVGGFEDEARGARAAAAGWRRSTWVAVLACGVFGGAFLCAAWRCAVLAQEADEARAMLLERRR